MGSYAAPWRSNAIQLVGILAKIQLTYPDSQAIWLSDVPIIDGTLTDAWGAATANEKKASIGVATSILTTEIDLSSVSGGEVNIVVRDVAYSHYTSTMYQYGTLAEVFTKYAAAGAAVHLYQYAKANGTQETRTVSAVPSPFLKGYVAAVTDFTPTTFTVRVSIDYAQTMGDLPAWSVGGDGPGSKVWPYDQPGEKSKSKGLAIPLRLGPPDWVPLSMESVYTHVNRRYMNGIWRNPALMPLRMTCDWNQKSNYTSWYWGAQENPGNLYSYLRDELYTGGLTPRLYSAIPGLPNLGQMEIEQDATITTTESISRTNGFYQFKTPKYRKNTAMILPTDLAYSNATGNPQAMIDRRPDTWCKLTGGQGVRWKIPVVNPGGTITPALGAIRVYVMSVDTPPGEVAATGTFKLGIAKPTGAWQGATPGSISVTTTVPKSYTVPVTEWRGTRFQRFDFTVSDTNTGGTADDLLYVASYVGEPFCIQIIADAGAVVYINAIWLDCTYVSGVDNFEPYVYRLGSGMAGGILRGFGGAVEEYGPEEYPYRDTIRPQWGRGEQRSGRRVAPKDNVVDPDGAYVWHPGFWDEVDTYGGGQSWIQFPGAMCNYLATNYTRPVQGLTKGTANQPQLVTNFGTVKYFDEIMQGWSQLHQSFTGGYRMYWWKHDQGGTDEAIAAILSECPGSPAQVPKYDGSPGLVAMDINAGNQYQHPCTWEGGISFRDVITSTDGIPNFEATISPASEIINDIEVHYQFDPHSRTYGAIARANNKRQDDGSSAAGGLTDMVPWPLTPGIGKSAIALCQDSMNAFTSGRALKKVFQLNYVWDSAVAVAFGCWKLWRYWRPFAIVRFIGTMACQDMLPGMVISFSNDLYTIGGIVCPIPFTHPGAGSHPTWTSKLWHVTGNRRIDAGSTVQYEITAVEHLNGSVGFAALSGGPPTVPAEGFDQ